MLTEKILIKAHEIMAQNSKRRAIVVQESLTQSEAVSVLPISLLQMIATLLSCTSANLRSGF